MTILTPRYSDAVDYARKAHAGQVRKGSNIPYLYHVLGVSSLVLEFGGNEDQAIAGLLHDVIEDCGAEHEPVIRERYGDAVAAIVLDCTDGTAESKSKPETPDAKRADWLARKQRYIAHLADASDATLLVSACDKLHNARAILQDLENEAVGMSVFERFTGKRDNTLAYYESLSRIFSLRHAPPARELDNTVARMHAMGGLTERRALEA